MEDEAPSKGRTIAERLFANEADPAFRRRAAWIGEMLSEPNLMPGAAVLDAGCGRGFYFPLYQQLGLVFTGLENDPALVENTSCHAVERGGVFHNGSVEHMPFPDGKFDCVVFSEVLEHLKEPVRALQEAFRVLRPSGLLLVSVPFENYPFLWDPINFVLESVAGRHISTGSLAGIWANHEKLYSTALLRTEVESAGFSVLDVFTHTSACFPFVHNIVYGLGKPMLEANVLPKAWHISAARGAGKSVQGNFFDPIRWGIKLIHLCDSFNGKRAEPGQRAQNICLVARS